VVADSKRTEKSICLAVTPSLKSYGISGRARLFELVRRVKEVNAERKQLAPGRRLTGASYNYVELCRDKGLAVDYIVATPRMAHYIKWSARVYSVYLKHIAPEDIHV
jgi:DNA polymerase V